MIAILSSRRLRWLEHITSVDGGKLVKGRTPWGRLKLKYKKSSVSDFSVSHDIWEELTKS